MSTVTNGMALNAAAFSKPPANLNGFGHVTLPGEPHSVTLSSPMTGLSDEDDDDDVPLLSQSSRLKAESETPKRPLKRKAPTLSSVESEDEDSDDDDAPLASSQVRSAAVPMPGAVEATTVSKRAVNGKGKTKANGSKSKPKIPDGDTSGDDDEPLGTPKANGKGVKKMKIKQDEDLEMKDEEAPKKKKKVQANGKPKAVKMKKDVVVDTQTSSSKRASKASASSQENVKPKKRAKPKKEEETDSGVPPSPSKKAKKEEEDAEEQYKWWEAANQENDGSIKWTTLEHNGVIFPPPYEPLPSNVKMKYAGKPVDLPPESEEVAGFYGAMIETDHAQDAVFNKNFFIDFKKVLKDHPPRDGTNIEKFELCDFRQIYEWHEAQRAAKKALSSAEKKQLKAEKDKLEEPFTTCLLDGRKEKVGNFRVEPPGLFRGRGEHPRKGSLKLRLRPEDITINISEGVPIPVPNMPGKWKKVIHDQTVTWLANWTENINGNHKYVFLAAGSSLKGQSDMMKFEKARELKNHVDRIRLDYQAELRSKVMADRQRATAMYFIDKLALRAGNEKGEDEADTVGCCSLRCEHLTLEPPSFLIFDFLGKDSIRFYKRVEVEPQIFKNIRIFKENKEDSDALFDRVTTTLMNKHLASYMKGLTAKVFRTYNASITFQEQLDLVTPKEGTTQEKLNAYNKANRLVAILCNHQRTVPKTHAASMEKMTDKLRAIKYERMKLRHVLFEIDIKYKKRKEFKDDESDLEDDWIAKHESTLKEKELEKARKKFEKDNEKAIAEGKKAAPERELKERLEEIEEDFRRLEKERGTKKASLKRQRAPEKIEEAVNKLGDRIKTTRLQMEDREEGKEVALGTSKINYLDPRITAAWCATYDVPIEKIFSKTLLVKFPWAMEVDADWKF